MRLTAAFFANRAEVVNGMLNVDGGFWNSTTVAPDAMGFQSYTVVLCDVDADDVGQPFSLIVDGQGPSGHRWAPANTSSFTLDSTILFLCIPMVVLPIEPGGGLHHYTFRLDGQHERVDVPLTVYVESP